MESENEQQWEVTFEESNSSHEYRLLTQGDLNDLVWDLNSFRNRLNF